MPKDVDSDGRCDHGLPEANSCSYCQNYYDARIYYGNTDNGKCVWVPWGNGTWGNGTCYPKKWAKDKRLSFDEECLGNFHVRWYRKYRFVYYLKKFL